MSLTTFLRDLFEHGRVATESAAPSSSDQQAAVEVLREFEAHYRAEWPGETPQFSENAALWSAMVLYRACHFVVERDADPDNVRNELLAECPEPIDCSTIYSVDLSFRFLRDVIRIAKVAAPDDPLVEALLELGRRWPLSSVGIEGVGEVDASEIVKHSSLRKEYVDRIIRWSDTSRLDDQQVREAAAAALGMHVELSPAIAGEIERLNHGTSNTGTTAT